MQSGDGDGQQNANTSEHLQGTSERPKSATEVLQECADPDLALIQDRWPKFARMIGVSEDTLQNWEQGRRHPREPAKALLRVFEKNPKAVVRALG
jgi:putative transcriptional regulator